LVERQPFARWQIDGRIEVIDQDGTVLPEAKSGDYRGLRLIIGRGAAPKAEPLFSMLMSEPALFRRVVAAAWVGDRRWNLRLANGVTVELPERHADAAWQHLARLERQQSLLEKAVTVVDMRLADRITLELQPGARADFDEAGTQAGSGRG
jgi:cell division protein FtsQ